MRLALDRESLPCCGSGDSQFSSYVLPGGAFSSGHVDQAIEADGCYLDVSGSSVDLVEYVAVVGAVHPVGLRCLSDDSPWFSESGFDGLSASGTCGAIGNASVALDD